MEFLGISPFQLLTIVVVAYIFLGPKKMGQTGRALGKVLGQLRRQTTEFTALLMEDMDDTKEETARKRSQPPSPEDSVPRESHAEPNPVEPQAPAAKVNPAQPVTHDDKSTDSTDRE